MHELKLNEEKDKMSKLLKINEDLKKKINQLEKELNEEKMNNQNLKNNYNDLQSEFNKIEKKLKEENKKKEDLNSELEKLKNYSNNIGMKKIFELMEEFKNKEKELMEELKIKEKELKEIKSKLPFDLSDGEHLMTIIFNSMNQKIHYSFICKNTDKFSRLEGLLYDIEDYQEFKETDNYFLVRGKKIKRYKTLEENGIKNSDVITLVRLDEE